MKTIKIFVKTALFMATLFLGAQYAKADEVTGSITITVGAPTATVDVKVDTVDGPINRDTGDDVAVSWTSTNASECTCTCQDGNGNPIDCGSRNFLDENNKSFCGSGKIIESTNPVIISGILRPTIFKVSCNP